MDRRTLILSILAVAGCTPMGDGPPGPSDILNQRSYRPEDPMQGPYRITFDNRADYGIEVGDILVSTPHKALIYQIDQTNALLYPVGVGVESQQWTGVEYVTRKAVNPRWTPTRAMIARNPTLYGQFASGIPGGDPRNPMGSRALYLGNTFYRIHGTNDQNRIGRFASNGCVNMHDRHVQHLYPLVPVGTKVIVV